MYSVTVTDANGGTGTASATLTHFPSPNFSLGPHFLLPGYNLGVDRAEWGKQLCLVHRRDHE